jgi:uncharacterized membrane protein YhaH (DUF805 family)
MGQYFRSLKFNLGGLVRFTGRESSKMFWLYAGTVIGLVFAAMFAVMIPNLVQTMIKMQAYAAKHPEDATIDQGPGHYEITIRGNHPELMPDMGAMVSSFSVVVLLAVALLAAAVARRLHDSGKSALWGLLPLPFLTFGFVMMPKIFRDFTSSGQPDFALFGMIFLNNLIYLICLVVLVILLTQKGTLGSNKFGDERDVL